MSREFYQAVAAMHEDNARKFAANTDGKKRHVTCRTSDQIYVYLYEDGVHIQTVLEIPCATLTSLWIMTTTDKGQKHLFDTRFDAIPFLSRFTYVETSSDEATMEAFARRAMFIAQAENLDGQPLSAYRQLAVECDCNLRQMIQRIAGGCMLT